MVDDGLSRAEAAEAEGISDNWLYQQLRRPEVLAYRNQRREVIRTSEGARAIKRIADLAQSANSEAVRFDANRLLLATDPAEPIVPLQCNESTINHKGLGPGLIIQIATPSRPVEFVNRSADGKPPMPHPELSHDRPAEFVSREKHGSPPVPHPAWGKQKSEPDAE